MTDEDSRKTIGDIHVTLGDHNRVGHIGHVVNEAPAPQFRTLSSNVSESNGVYTTTALIEVDAPYPVANLYLEVRSPTLIAFDVVPQRVGGFQRGHTGKRESFHFTNIPNASGRYLLTVRSSSPNLEFGWNFAR
jgi:hypothetical protein